MQTDSMSGVSFKFCRPSGSLTRQPIEAMARALKALSESDEMRLFVATARRQRKTVVLELFHNADGQLLLIYPKAVSKSQRHG